MRLKIFYGSQSGNAQDLAEKVYRYSLNLPTRYFLTSIQEMNKFTFDDNLKDDILIFICSTTGQGEAPDNMKYFWKLIMHRSFQKDLKCCHFGVFGLGDSKYEKYNFIAKKLFRRFIQLGAKPIIQLGLADDQHPLGIDGEFLPWIRSLWTSISDILKSHLNVNNLFENCSQSVNFMKYGVSVLDNGSNHDDKLCPPQYKKLYIKCNDRVTPNDHFQETRFLTFNKCDLEYDIGDILFVFPRNSNENIDMFFKLSKFDRNCVISINHLDISYTLPDNFPRSAISIQEIVKNCFDLNCTPRKSFFEIFAEFSKNDIEKERLLELISPSNLDDLYSYCFHPRRTVIEVLQDFPNTTSELSLIQWINLMPFIRPREYSIASSPVIHCDEISILVAVVRYKTKLFGQRVGLCSDFLSKLDCNDFVFAKIKKGKLHFPSIDSSIIFISPGTGIAAFRGCISERLNKSATSETMMCYGSRFKDKDFYFADELQKFNSEGSLKLVTAFSREENCYIQHKLKEHSTYIWKIIMECSGYIFVCGRSVDMPQQVREEIKMILKAVGNLTEDKANSVLQIMEKRNKYQVETWS